MAAEAWPAHIKKGLENPKAREWIRNDVYWNAILRNTISLTALQGSNKTNVIPAEASAELDIRLLPATDTAHRRDRSANLSFARHRDLRVRSQDRSE